MEDDSAEEQPVEEPKGVGLDRHRADEAIYQGFDPGPMKWGQGPDGLPVPAIQGNLPLAPPLSPSTLVCLADTSEFVMRDRWGEVVGRFKPERVKRAANGAYFVEVSDAVDAGVPWLHLALVVGRALSVRVPVEPVRPQCKHLARQMTDFEDLAEHQFVERLCTARRDSNAFFLSVRDGQYHACELRSPPDPESVQRLDRFDEIKIALGRERMESEGSTFDVDAALGREQVRANEGGSSSSIFANKKD